MFRRGAKALFAILILDFMLSSAGLVKNEGKKDGFMASNSSAAAKEPSKHEDVTLNKVVKAIALPLLLSVTDSLFGK